MGNITREAQKHFEIQTAFLKLQFLAELNWLSSALLFKSAEVSLHYALQHCLETPGLQVVKAEQSHSDASFVPTRKHKAIIKK